MEPKKIAKALLFPNIAVLLVLLPIATVLLVYSMVVLGTNAILSYISYLLSAYTLTVWCVRIPQIIRLVKEFKNENKYAQKWLNDAKLRVNVSLCVSLIWNAIYGIFQLCLGLYHHTFWFYSLGAYYVCLALMRFGLVRHTRKHAPGEKLYTELIKYRLTGWIFLVMNLSLSVIIFFMVRFNRTFEHNMITSIAMAAYTFTTLTVAIINVIRYRKYNCPIFSASKAISLTAALVSMLTLESTMLTAFGDGKMSVPEQKLLLGLTGAAISAIIVATAIYMIVIGTKKLKQLKAEV